MVSFKEVTRYLTWRAAQMRDDARKARLLTGPASDLFAVALEDGADALGAAAEASRRASEAPPAEARPLSKLG